MSKKGLLVVLSGPSGSGKDTLVEYMLEHNPHLKISVSATTRNPRPGEQNGKDYFFLSEQEFLQRVKDDQMLEHTHYVGNYYGTPKKELVQSLESGDVILLVIEVQGGMQVKKLMGDDALLLFIHAPTFEELRQRLENRGTDTDESIESRLNRALEEMEYAADYDHVAVNDTVERCAEELLTVINNEVAERNE